MKPMSATNIVKTKGLVAALMGAVSLASLAQTHASNDFPAQSQIEAKRKEVLNALNQNKPNVGQAGIQLQANRTGLNAVASLPGSTQTISKSTKDDFLSLVRPGAEPQKGSKSKAAEGGDLMIFVSLTMPDGMLEQYAAQAKRFNATLVLRGFVDDKLSTTRDTLARLNKVGAQWDISPEPFKTFKIDKVPAIVLSTASSESIMEDGCAHPDAYTAVFGDISVYDALDKMYLRGQKRIAVLAKQRLMDDRRSATARPKS